MAISGTVYSPYQTKWGISEESTFGTIIADAGTFEQFEGPIPDVNYGLIRSADVKFGSGRVRNDENVYVSESGGLREISFSDLLVRRIDLGSLLYAVCQTVSEAIGSPFQKDYDITTTTTQPDFTSNAGYFATVAIYDPIASYHRKFPSCILRELTLSADLTGDGLLRASGTWISGFSASMEGNLSGTWAYNAQNYYNFGAPTAKTINSVDVVLYGFSLTINNGAVRVGNNTSGHAETYALATSTEGYSVTGEITVKYDANTDSLQADMKAGTDRAIRLAVGTDSAAGYFDIQVPGALFGDIKHEYGDERGTAITIPFTAVDSGGALLNLEVEDGQDQGW